MNQNISILFLGILSGILGGLLGAIGPSILLPGLLLLKVVPNIKTAIGTVLLTILPPISLLAVLEYYKKGYIVVPISILLMIGYFFGAFIGSTITLSTSDRLIQFINGVLFLLIGIFFLWKSTF